MKKLSGYGDLPANFTSYKDSKIIILPVPFDKTSTWIKGADKGPGAIIEASANMELYDIETESEVYQKGIHTNKPIKKSSSESMVTSVYDAVLENLKNQKFTVVLGGEHSVSIGSIQAHRECFKNMSVLQLDAHADLREEYEGSPYNHACVMARARENCPIVQVGIRSMDISEVENSDTDRIFYAHKIFNNSDWHENAINKLTDEVYITIDLDVFDISIMPSTGTPEPGGLLWYDVLNFLKIVCRKKKIVGFDIVELCPNKNSKPYNFMAAKLIYKLLSYIYEGK